MAFTLAERLRLETDVVGGRLVTRAFRGDEELRIDRDLLDALAGLTAGRTPPPQIVGALVRLGILADVVTLPPTGRLALRPTTAFEVIREARRQVSPDGPRALFVPPDRLGALQALARRLRDAWRRLVSAAHARGRIVEPGLATRVLADLVRHALDRDPALAKAFRLDDSLALVPLAPLDEAELQYPVAELRFRANRAEEPGVPRPQLRSRVAPGGAAELGRLLGRLTSGIEAAELDGLPPPLSLLARGLFGEGLFGSVRGPQPLGLAAGEIQHLGHATLLANLGGAHVLFDPWLPAASAGDTLAPPAAAALPPLAGIFLTQDEWDLETLLRLDKSVPLYGPPHLAELGFAAVRALAAGEVVAVGDGGQVTALSGGSTLLGDPRGRALIHAEGTAPAPLVFASRRQAKAARVEAGWEFLLRPAAEWPLADDGAHDAAFLGALAAGARASTVVLYAEGGADWYPEDAGFLRRRQPSPLMAPHEYLWDDLPQIRAAVAAAGAELVLSAPYDRFRLGGPA